MKVQLVKEPSQLPPFLVPSALSPTSKIPAYVALDCEGVQLGRLGRLCILQVYPPPLVRWLKIQIFDGDEVYVIDVIEGASKGLMSYVKEFLESDDVCKVVHDCRADSEALHFQFNVKLRNVFDTQVPPPPQQSHPAHRSPAKSFRARAATRSARSPTSPR
jgi:hypothetical protein